MNRLTFSFIIVSFNKLIINQGDMKLQQKQQECLSQLISSQIYSIGPSTHLFKIFGHQKFNFEKAYAKSIADWSGFYTQISPQHSMRYLTKKWDDGADYGCLVLIQPKMHLKLLKLQSKGILSSPKISGLNKANAIKNHIDKMIKHPKDNKELKEYQKYQFKKNGNQTQWLLKLMGDKQTLVSCIDYQDVQIIIPHQLLNEKYFSYRTLVQFKKSNDGMLRTIGWKIYQNPKQNFEQQTDQSINNRIWNNVKGQCQFQPYLILEEVSQIKILLENLKQQAQLAKNKNL